MTPEIDLWFSCGSTYTYLTMMRLSCVEADHGVRFNLRPFYLGALFKEIGRAPFLEEPQKTKYMWRDIERRATRLGLSPRLPAPYPAPNVVLANQVAYLGLQKGWGQDYLQVSYRNWFENGLMPGDSENLARSLSEVEQDKEEILAEISEGRVHENLVSETDLARSLGIFGAPTCAVDKEIFWGDDRLEEAVRWAKAIS